MSHLNNRWRTGRPDGTDNILQSHCSLLRQNLDRKTSVHPVDRWERILRRHKTVLWFKSLSDVRNILTWCCCLVVTHLHCIRTADRISVRPTIRPCWGWPDQWDTRTEARTVRCRLAPDRHKLRCMVNHIRSTWSRQGSRLKQPSLSDINKSTIL